MELHSGGIRSNNSFQQNHQRWSNSKLSITIIHRHYGIGMMSVDSNSASASVRPQHHSHSVPNGLGREGVSEADSHDSGVTVSAHHLSGLHSDLALEGQRVLAEGAVEVEDAMSQIIPRLLP